MSARNRLITLLTVLALCAAIATSATRASAADETPGEPSAKTAAGQSAPLFQPGVDDFLLMPGPDGRLVPVPAADLREFLEWQKSRPDEQADGPDHSVVAVKLDGSAEAATADMTVTLTVRVLRDDAWVRVPLRMNDAVIRSGEHQFDPDGEAPTDGRDADGSAAFADFDRTAGYRWWFRGRGVHTLTLRTMIAVKRVAGSRQMELDLPKAAASSVSLLVPVPVERVQLPAEPAELVEAKAGGPNRTRLEAFGLGERLDLTWQVLPDPKRVKPVIQVHTDLQLSVGEDALLLRGKQVVEAAKGSFSTVRVSLPADFDVSLPKLNGERSEANVTAEGHTVTIRLTEETTGPLELDWTLEAPLPEGGRVTLSDFEVAGATRHTGEIVVGGFSGHRVIKRAAENVHRTNVPVDAGGRDVASAYQFWKQPFRLELELQPVTPVYAMRPVLLTEFSQDAVRLTASYDVEVFRGAVTRLELEWPGYAAEGWRIDPSSLPLEVERFESDDALDDDSDDDSGAETKTLAFELVRAVEEGGRVRLSFTAERPIDRGDPAAGSFPLTLPRSSTRHHTKPLLLVDRDDRLEVRLSSDDDAQPRLLPGWPEGLNRDDLPAQVDARRLAVYECPTEPIRLDVALIEHEPRLDASVSTATRLSAAAVEIAVEAVFRAPFDKRSEVRFTVAEGFPRETLRVSVDGEPAMLTWPEPMGTGRVGGRAGVITFSPRYEQFTLSATYRLPSPASWPQVEDVALAVPLLQFTGVDRGEFRARLDCEPEAVVRLVEPEGLTRSAGPDGPLWSTEALPERLQFDLSRDEVRAPRHAVVDRMFVHSDIGASGRVACTAVCRVESVTGPVVLTLPAEAEVGPILWNGAVLTPVRLPKTGAGGAEADGTRLELPLPPSDSSSVSEPGLLSVEYQFETGREASWRQSWEMPEPRFDSAVWVGDVLWRVRLPAGMCLFNAPREYGSAFEWTRHGLLWWRTPPAELAEPLAWVQNGQGGGQSDGQRSVKESMSSTSAAGPIGRSYLFARYGSAERLALSGLSQSAVVFFGAGLALGLGFLFVKVSLTRNVLTALALAAAVALAAVWYPGPVSLLLQPAILGMTLAVIAGLLDARLRRRRRPTVLSLQPASSLAAMSGTAARALGTVGSEDPTAVRAAIASRRAADDSGARHSGARDAGLPHTDDVTEARRPQPAVSDALD